MRRVLRHATDEHEPGDDHNRAADAEQPRDDARQQAEQRYQHPRHGSCPFPQPPPPGVSMRRTSPVANRSAVLDGSDSPFNRFLPTSPANPPAAPAGGLAGEVGRNLLNGESLPSKTALRLATGDVLRIETPGGGGWGKGQEP